MIRRLRCWREARIVRQAYRERIRSMLVILFTMHASIDAVEHFRRNVAHARARRDEALSVIRERSIPAPSPAGITDNRRNPKTQETTMKTTWDHAPHGADGKLDYDKLRESAVHGQKMLEEGKEGLIGAYQVAQADGTFLTIYHHAPAGHPEGDKAIAAAQAHLKK